MQWIEPTADSPHAVTLSDEDQDQLICQVLAGEADESTLADEGALARIGRRVVTERDGTFLCEQLANDGQAAERYQQIQTRIMGDASALSASVRLARRWFPPTAKCRSAQLSVDEQAGVLSVRGRPSKRAVRQLLAHLQRPARALRLPEDVLELAVRNWGGLPDRRVATLALVPLAERTRRTYQSLLALVEKAQPNPSREERDQLPRWQQERELAADAAGLLDRFLPHGQTASGSRGHNAAHHDRTNTARLRNADETPSAPEVTVRFHAQAWISNVATSVDPLGPDTFTVPSRDAQDRDGRWLADRSDASDQLRTHANAPAWIREWAGPYEVEIEHP